MIPFKHPNGGDCEHACCLKIEHLSVKFGGEAALDDVNLTRLIDAFNELRAHAQLIIITHQQRTMSIADALYGVTMRADGVTAVVSQKLDK